jgi:hypothetical protein
LAVCGQGHFNPSSSGVASGGAGSSAFGAFDAPAQLRDCRV